MARNVPWALIKKELQRWAFLLLLFVFWLVRLQEENLVLGTYGGRCLGTQRSACETCCHGRYAQQHPLTPTC